MTDTERQAVTQLIALAHREHCDRRDELFGGLKLPMQCNCGADEHNAEVARLAAILKPESTP